MLKRAMRSLNNYEDTRRTHRDRVKDSNPGKRPFVVKSKPPRMRRVEFSGRIQIPRPVAHTKSEKTHTPHNKKQGKTGIFLQKSGILTKTHTTCTRTRPQFSKHLHPTHPKIPYKN